MNHLREHQELSVTYNELETGIDQPALVLTKVNFAISLWVWTATSYCIRIN